MKKFLLLMGAIFLLLSCSNDRSDELKTSEDFNSKISTFINADVAIETSEGVKLAVSEQQLLHVFKEFSDRSKLDLKPISTKVVEIDELPYLRVYHEDGKVTTVALIDKGNGTYKTGGVSCTSVQRASSGGCVPNGQYCTSGSPLKGECSRTTSSGGDTNT